MDIVMDLVEILRVSYKLSIYDFNENVFFIFSKINEYTYGMAIDDSHVVKSLLNNKSCRIQINKKQIYHNDVANACSVIVINLFC